MRLKLNVCCGGRVLAGWTNIDIVASEGALAPDILCDALKVPLPDACAVEIMCIHGFEHFHRWDCDALLEEWKRMLLPGGLLVLELPNLAKCCENILSGFTGAGKHPDQAGMWGLYGDPRMRDPFMCHRWGWTPDSLRAILAEHGFEKIREEPTQHHPAGRLHRDMRMVARLP